MRIVSLVPSWTETLIRAGGEIVGRTRYCLHPADKVREIPKVGGTKKVDWKKIAQLRPDLVIFDREENTKEMAEECSFPWYATHVDSIENLPNEIDKLAEKTRLSALYSYSQRWRRIAQAPVAHEMTLSPPGLIEWKTPPADLASSTTLVYVIWAHPWMAAGPHTFIGSVCKKLGWELWKSPASKYPAFEPQSFADKNAIFLCSTEPYPFLKRSQVLTELPGAVAIVDGESLSWFGIRSLEYLEEKLRL